MLKFTPFLSLSFDALKTKGNRKEIDMLNSSGGNPSSGENAEEPRARRAESSSVPILEDESDFKAGKRELLILGTMVVLNVILALDATVPPPALPVSTFHLLQNLRLD